MNGLDLLAVVIILVALFLAAEYLGWRRRDQDRRTSRLVNRNIARACGR